MSDSHRTDLARANLAGPIGSESAPTTNGTVPPRSRWCWRVRRVGRIAVRARHARASASVMIHRLVEVRLAHPSGPTQAQCIKFKLAKPPPRGQCFLGTRFDGVARRTRDGSYRCHDPTSSLVHSHVSPLRAARHRANADGRVPILLHVRQLRRTAQAQEGRLLRVLLVWHREVPTHSGQFQLLRIRPRAAPLGQYGAFSLLGPVLING